MTKVKVKDVEYDLEDKDVALIEAILLLTRQIGRLANGRR